jgi:predicted chitinase
MSNFLGQSARECYYFLVPREVSVSISNAILNNHITIRTESEGYLTSPPALPAEVSYFLPYQTNSSLANNLPGDGLKFRGRGMKQLTGKYNYSEYWVYRGWLQRSSYSQSWWTHGTNKSSPVINNPEVVGDNPYDALDTAGYYFVWKKINAVADLGATEAASNSVTSLINPYENPQSPVRWNVTKIAHDVLGDRP